MNYLSQSRTSLKTITGCNLLTSIDAFGATTFTFLRIGRKIWHLSLDNAAPATIFIQIQWIPLHSSLFTLWLHLIHVYGWSVQNCAFFYSMKMQNRQIDWCSREWLIDSIVNCIEKMTQRIFTFLIVGRPRRGWMFWWFVKINTL